MYTLICWNKRKALATGDDEANRMARTLIHFGAVNVFLSRLTYVEVSAMLTR